MRKGSKKDDYKIDPLKRELKEMFQEFFKKGYTNYKYLQQSNTDHRRLLELYNKINEASKSKKLFILNEKQYSLHYRQYCYMEKYKRADYPLIRRPPKQLTRKQIVLNNIKEENQKATMAENKRIITAQSQDIIRHSKEIKQLKKDELSYIAQQNFLSVLEELEFYKTTISALRNIQVKLYNKINEKMEQDNDKNTQEYIVKLLEQYANIIKAYGLDKLLQLQPQVINFLKNENKNTIEVPEELKLILAKKED